MARLHPTIARAPRGAGYWLWKPWLLNAALAAADDGDVVMYSDAGATLVADPRPLVELTQRHPVLIFGQGTKARVWTKRDCFVLLNADSERYWDAPTRCASFQLYRAGPLSRAFVAELLAACTDPRILTDLPNMMGRDNLPEFREHRHDQAVLGILAERYRLALLPDPSQYGAPHAGAPYGQVFDHHRNLRPRHCGWVERLRRRLGFR